MAWPYSTQKHVPGDAKGLSTISNAISVPTATDTNVDLTLVPETLGFYPRVVDYVVYADKAITVTPKVAFGDGVYFTSGSAISVGAGGVIVGSWLAMGPQMRVVLTTSTTTTAIKYEFTVRPGGGDALGIVAE